MIAWTRKQPGWYEAEAAGLRWRIVQVASRRWEVLSGSGSGYTVVADWHVTLDDARSYVDDEVHALTDPEYAARREARRAARRARQAARAAS